MGHPVLPYGNSAKFKNHDLFKRGNLMLKKYQFFLAMYDEKNTLIQLKLLSQLLEREKKCPIKAEICILHIVLVWEPSFALKQSFLYKIQP